MRLSPLQELPVMEPGAVVRATNDFASVSLGDTVFSPVGPVVAEWPGAEGRIFAERGSVIVNPQTPGWEQTWRSVANESAQPMERFRRQARRDQMGMALTLGLLALMVVLLVRDAGRGTAATTWYYAGCAGSTAGVIRLGSRARRSLRALRRARKFREAPGRPFKMLLRWAVGYGHGPLAIALLWSEGEDRQRVRHVPVIGVPTGLFPGEPVDVIVRGPV
jgi:hypothetical protein